MFTLECVKAFKTFEECLISTPIVQAPDGTLPFKLITDASRKEEGVVLGPWKDGKLTLIHYASRTLNEPQLNYATIEKELLAIVYAFENFRICLLGYTTILYINNTAIRFLFDKKESKQHLMRQVLFLHEFDLEIRDKNWLENTVADHQSRLLKKVI